MNNQAVSTSLQWLADNRISVPRDLLAKIESKGIEIPRAMKDGDIADINRLL